MRGPGARENPAAGPGRLGMLTYTGVQRGGVGDVRRGEDQHFAQRQRPSLASVAHFGVLNPVQIANVGQPHRTPDKLCAAVPYRVL